LQGSGHFVNTLSTAGLIIKPTMAVYAGTKNAMRTIAEGMRLEAGEHLRVTNISPGMIRTDFAASLPPPSLPSSLSPLLSSLSLSPSLS
ncbi:SDR family NAD(P)-dependent oxidoreductase, partial [Rhizobium ruizarguesonis]